MGSFHTRASDETPTTNTCFLWKSTSSTSEGDEKSIKRSRQWRSGETRRTLRTSAKIHNRAYLQKKVSLSKRASCPDYGSEGVRERKTVPLTPSPMLINRKKMLPKKTMSAFTFDDVQKMMRRQNVATEGRAIRHTLDAKVLKSLYLECQSLSAKREIQMMDDILRKKSTHIDAENKSGRRKKYRASQWGRLIRTFSGRKQNTSKEDIDIPHDFIMPQDRGVSLSFLRHFAKKHNITKDMTTLDVVNRVIKQETSWCKDTYVSLVSDQKDVDGTRFVGTSSHFISHVWGSRFLDLIEALAIIETTSESAPRAVRYYYIDIFAINQYDPNARVGGLLHLAYPIYTSKSVLIVTSNWKHPYNFYRMWCVYECFKAIEYDAKCSIALTVDAWNDLITEIDNTIASGNSLEDLMREHLIAFNVRKAKATISQDAVEIREEIQTRLGHRMELMRICESLGLATSSIKSPSMNQVRKRPSQEAINESMQSNYFLNKSATGVVDGRRIEWNHTDQMVRDLDNDGAVVYDLNEGLNKLNIIVNDIVQSFVRDVFKTKQSTKARTYTEIARKMSVSNVEVRSSVSDVSKFKPVLKVQRSMPSPSIARKKAFLGKVEEALTGIEGTS